MLEIKPEAKHLTNVDFTVSRLAQRIFTILATWPSGQPIEGAAIHAALEHTSEWDQPVTAFRFWHTDAKGIAQVHLFGNSRVRVSAEKFVDDKKDAMPSRRYSEVVELDPTRLPRNLNLVISSTLRPQH